MRDNDFYWLGLLLIFKDIVFVCLLLKDKKYDNSCRILGLKYVIGFSNVIVCIINVENVYRK